MIIFGLLLILLAVGAGVWFYLALADLSAMPMNDLTALGVTVGFSPAALLLTGFGSAFLLLIGVYLIRAGISSNSRRRQERKELQRSAEENRKAAEAAAAERLRTERTRAPESSSSGSSTGSPGITDPVRDTDTGWRTRGEGEVPPPPGRS